MAKVTEESERAAMEKAVRAGRGVPAQLQLLPGFRFHPTDEELVVHYLSRKAEALPFSIPIIAELDLYKFDPWDLPEKALFGEQEWYFFSPRDRKYPNGSRPNRAAGSGFWKATGSDKPIHSAAAGGPQIVGVKKALVFYKGKAPTGVKTNWIMHEYRLIDSVGKPLHARNKASLRLDDWVLCRIYNRNVVSQKKKLREQKSACVGDNESYMQEDVLASLADIDESAILFQASNQNKYSLIERFLCGDSSASGTKSTSNETDLGQFQGGIMKNFGTDHHSILAQEDNRFNFADMDYPSDMKRPEFCQFEPLIKDEGSEIVESLRRPRAGRMPESLQNLH